MGFCPLSKQFSHSGSIPSCVAPASLRGRQIGGRKNDDGPILKKSLDGERIRKDGLAALRCQLHELPRHRRIAARASGPLLVHPLDMPEKLSDKAFNEAVHLGTPQTHWDYGPMKPIETLSQVRNGIDSGLSQKQAESPEIPPICSPQLRSKTAQALRTRRTLHRGSPIRVPSGHSG